jgi:general L-amino acid transport system permease protein
MSVATEERAVPQTSWLYDPKVRSLIFQGLLLGFLVWMAYEVVLNTAANLARLNQNFGWGFLSTTAGFDIIQRPISYSNVSSYGRGLVIGFLNTIIVAGLGIIAATVLGFTIGIMRLSRNFVISGVSTVYVECIRNVPLLIQILIWYSAVLKPLPSPKQAIDLGVPLPGPGFLLFVPLMVLAVYGFIKVFRQTADGIMRVGATVGLFLAFGALAAITGKWIGPVFSVIPLGGFLSNRGLMLPRPLFEEGAAAIAIALVAAIGTALFVRHWARRRQEETGAQFPVLWTIIALIIGLPLLAAILSGMPVSLEYPELKGFNFVGGLVVIPEFIALFLALSIYTSAFIAEIVRAGILAVSHGQSEAAHALGLRAQPTLRLVIIPQALRVIIPPLTSQYLNLTKNSSLAVAIAYPELVAVGGTILNQTGKAIEIISMWMAVYLSLSLLTSALMNWYNARKRLVER